MLSIKFNGWFQCRLAVDPDPADEPRGISGYMKALPGEPDFDRIIRLQPAGTFPRLYTEPIGVKVKAVYNDQGEMKDHALIGAAVTLMDDPIYKGANEIIAEGGYEPIVPFRIRIYTKSFLLDRGCTDSPEFSFPYTGLRSSGSVFNPGRIAESTSIYNIHEHLQVRISNLGELQSRSNDPVEQLVIQKRINFLKTGTASFFFKMMLPYQIALGGKTTFHDPYNIMNGMADIEKEWNADFWMGAWDPDAASGFMEGYLNITQVKHTQS